MFRHLAFAILATFGLFAAALRADPLPQGQFLLGTYVWPDSILARYTVLSIQGDTLVLRFSYPLPLNFQACERGENCIYDARAATAQLALTGDTLTLSNVEIDTDAPIEPSAEKYTGKPAHALYTTPMLALLNNATLHSTPTGFQLNTGALKLDFYRADDTAIAAAQSLPITHSLSIARLAACEVRAIAPLFLNPSPNADEQRRLNVLTGFVQQLKLEQKTHALNPILGKPSDADKARAKRISLTMRLPVFAAGLFPDPGEPFVEPLWEKPGKAMFNQNRAAYDAALGGYGNGLNDLVEYYRYMRKSAPKPTIQEVCDDPLLGFANTP
ncbi:hypothetical protein N4R57_21905 [Rhodobacteraceae bacterium D3-12]|nr:hypothetical protein N4R57_21905 [Rhodobacteraceae bacterium D3-12]